MGFDRSAFADGVHALVRLAFDIDLHDIQSHQCSDMRPDLGFAISKFWALEDDRCIKIHRLIASLRRPAQCFAQEISRVSPFVDGICIGKQLPYIGEGQRSEEGISHGVEQDISIGMSDRAAVMLERDPADDQRPAGSDGGDRFQTMQVISVSDAQELPVVVHG